MAVLMGAEKRMMREGSETEHGPMNRRAHTGQGARDRPPPDGQSPLDAGNKDHRCGDRGARRGNLDLTPVKVT